MADDSTCPDCSRPWAQHDEFGCSAWPPGEPKCACEKTPVPPADDPDPGDATDG